MIVIGKTPPRKPRVWLFWLLVLGPFVACGLYFLLLQWALVWHRTSKEHFYSLEETPPFLSEALALEKAKATLAAEGYAPADWEPDLYDAARAPEGPPDRWFHRSTAAGDRGVFYFQRRGDLKPRQVCELIVRVELRGKQIVCQVQRAP